MRPKTCRHLLIATAACALLHERNATPPANPAALWTLLPEARLVVLADVHAVTDCALWKGLPPGFPPPPVCRGATDHLVAELDVRESWKLHDPWIRSGEERLDVHFDDIPACPEPPRYDQGDRVIALLRPHGDAWVTVGRSFGALHPRTEDVQSWRMLVLEALNLQAEAPVAPQAQSDWVTRAGSLEATR